MLKRILVSLFCVLAGIITFAPAAFASTQNDSVAYERGRVISTKQEQGKSDTARVLLLSGSNKGQTVTASTGAVINSLDLAPPAYKPGNIVVISQDVLTDGKPNYVIIDHYRLSFALWMFIGIVALAIAFAGWRGIGSLLGLILSIAVIAKFIIPQILHGQSPYLATALGVMVISLLGIFIAHGFSRRTSLALASTYITLAVAVLLSAIVVGAMHLSGISDENTFYLNQLMPGLNIQGLLLCGMIISLIGILDDITVGQATAVEELHKANAKLTTRELYNHGIKIGREHIASLINTLVLAYVGTSFLFIVFISATSPYPLLINLNSELVMEEIARSLIGSAALILAVPITTLLAARFLPRQNPGKKIVSKTPKHATAESE